MELRERDEHETQMLALTQQMKSLANSFTEQLRNDEEVILRFIS